jgi:hypothetical protein
MHFFFIAKSFFGSAKYFTLYKSMCRSRAGKSGYVEILEEILFPISASQLIWGKPVDQELAPLVYFYEIYFSTQLIVMV